MISEERIKKFWEWCGTEGVDYLHPDTGLSSLFKWAVPKLDYFCITNEGETNRFYAEAVIGETEVYTYHETDPAIALFLAIEKLMEEK